MSISQKSLRRQKLRWRIRTTVSGTAQKPRLSVFRSNKDIYAQLIDDTTGTTLAAASSQKVEAESATKAEQSTMVGKAIAAAALEKGIKEVVFDRSGYLYHGRVKQLAEGAREGGLKF
jgi:large subunit ribosomal protein L18